MKFHIHIHIHNPQILRGYDLWIYLHCVSKNATPPCESWKPELKKFYWFWLHPQETVGLFLQWGHFEQLIKHLTVVRQTVSRLLTL